MRASLLLLAAAGATACGGDAVRDAVDPIAEAATATQRQTSAKMTIVSEGTVNGQALRATGSGVIQFRPAKLALTMKTSVAGQSFSIDEVMDGTAMFMRFPAELRRNLPEGRSWVKLDLGRIGGGALGAAMSQSQDPATALKLLQAISSAKATGSETIAGVRTTHFHGVADYAAMAKSGPPAIRKVAALSLKYTARRRVPIDVWVDDQKRIRRQRMLVATKAIGSTPAQTQTITTEFTSYGVDTSGIEPPSASKTHDVTDEVAAEMGGA
jgi:hypothetical protein